VPGGQVHAGFTTVTAPAAVLLLAVVFPAAVALPAAVTLPAVVAPAVPLAAA
jgi:hypothetical protein